MRDLRHLLAALALACSSPCFAYGVTGHLRVVFENWDLLFAKELGRPVPDRGLAFAAALGAITADIGYAYPELVAFTERVHYLRASEFPERLIDAAKHSNDPKLLAFALGVRAHYWADRIGHPGGTNELVGVLRRREGADVPPARRRWAYEDDPDRHMRVESRAVFFDLRTASKAALDGYERYLADIRESKQTVAAMADLVQLVMTKMFPASKNYPDAEQLWSYALYAAETICTGASAASPEPPQETTRLARRCNDDSEFHADRPRKIIREISEQNLKDLVTPLAPDGEANERKIYDVSHEAVRRALKDAALRARDPRVNLDTDLPRAAQTYGLADRAMKAVLESAQRQGTPSDVTLAMNFDDDYQIRGREVRAYFSQPMSSASRAATLLASKQLEALASVWLAGDLTFRNQVKVDYLLKLSCEGSGEPLRLPQHRTSVIEFALAPNGRLCIRTDARLIDTLYALAIVNQSAGKPAQKAIPVAVAGWAPAYLESLRALRLERH
jgi:zinc dependent phospholipase C